MVIQAKLITQLEEGWEYKVEYNDCGAYLYLSNYLEDTESENEINPLDITRSYLLIFKKARMLTAKEFSEAYRD